MRFRDYLKDRFLFLLLNTLFFCIIIIPLLAFKASSDLILLLLFVWFAPLLTYIIIEYFKFKRYYKQMLGAFENLDQKYLIAEVIKSPHFIEGKLLHELLQDSTRQMQEHVKYHRQIQQDYQEYIESWVHEVKTPIASISLIYDNNQDNIPRHLMHEVSKVESYIDQVLYYARSQDVSTDYLVKQFNLDSTVKTIIKKNATDLIQKRIAVNLDVTHDVYSDPKWVEFILNQIIGNAVKYSQPGGSLTLTSQKKETAIVLSIVDSGIGINERDLRRVFEKGFTGENGRLLGRSTGMGLYLCAKLCKRLGLGLTIDSIQNSGTTVKLTFPIGNTKIIKDL